MAYEFTGFFAKPVVSQPDSLPSGAVWREIEVPFVGVGVRLPKAVDRRLPPNQVASLAKSLGLDAADAWIYLTYLCWGGSIDFVLGLGIRDGVPFGVSKEDADTSAKAAYVGLMERFGVSSADALRFEPFR